jgi:hypothetical protein
LDIPSSRFHSVVKEAPHLSRDPLSPPERSHRTSDVSSETPPGISSANRKLLKKGGFFFNHFKMESRLAKFLSLA